MSFAQLPRIHTVDKRIQESGNFFRIEEAEAVIANTRDKLQRRLDAKLERKEKRKREGKSAVSPTQDVLPEVYPAPFFTAHVLNSDPALSKFVDYDELVFPKPYTVIEGLQPEFIDKLWVSGFLDRSNRDANKLAKEEAAEAARRKKKGLKGILKKHAAPGDDVSSASVDNGGDEEYVGDANVTTNTLRGDKKKGRLPPARIDPNTAHIREQASNLSGDISALESEQSNSTASISLGARQARETMELRASDREVRRLKALEADRLAKIKKAKEQKHITEMVKPYADNVAEYLLKKQTKDWIPGVKQREEAEANAGIPAEAFASFFSSDLDRIFDRERQEKEAATVLQRMWRNYKRLVPWKYAIKCMLAASRIQRLVRGGIVRKWVAKWHKSRTKVVTKLQANIRRMQSNNVAKPRLKLEQAMVLRIQRVVRGKIGRLKWARVRWNIAASHIQALWRGVVARSLCDRRWLDKVVVPIQQMARKAVARRYVATVRAELNAAALVIQKKIRSRQSAKKLTRKLLLRENEYRMDTISCATTEEEYWQEKIGMLVMRLVKKDVQAKAEASARAMQDALDGVYTIENDLIEMNRQREILSPRAIVQGFYQELNKNCIDLRNKVTDAKLKALFETGLASLNMDAQLEAKVKEIEDVASVRDQLAFGREADNAEKLERSQQREQYERVLRKRRAIAHERRKWQVRFTTKNGKPDKKRRPGRPWDPSILAKEDKQTYTAANVDIFAESQRQGLKPGETGSVDSTLQRMSLQTYLEEVNAYEQILNPITQAMQKAFGGEAGKPQPSDLGYGKLGDTIPPAMWSINAVPPAWARPLSPGGTTALTAQQVLAMKLEKEEEERRRELEGGDEGDQDGEAGGGGAGGPRGPRVRGLYNLADPKNERQKLIDAAEFERKKHVAEQNHQRALKRAERARAKKRPPAVIPWALLDELDGEKRAWESEKAYMEFNLQRASRGSKR